MDITTISDLHGYHPTLPGGDLLIVAGDLTARDTITEYMDFYEWLDKQDYKKKVVIAGNHDGLIENGTCKIKGKNSVYLQDSGIEFEGLKIWGSPWTPVFCDWSFMKRRGADINERWELIPDDTNILITHGPPWGILDKCYDESHQRNKLVGCKDLRNHILGRLKDLKLHVFGHVHEWGGKIADMTLTKFVNASIMDEHYEPVNNPVRIVL